MAYVVRGRNVNHVLPELVKLIKEEGVESESRNGPVLYLPEPITVTYERPVERVMTYPERDANPFFHLMETMWMFSGSNKVSGVVNYAKQLVNYTEDGEEMRGAYGHRIRKWFKHDQFETAIYRLRNWENDRRTVIQLWDGREDLVKHNRFKDHPCNQNMILQINNGALDMTVTNRSNDLLWGMTGANAVHFSFFQEYIASAVGVPVGKYHHFSTNLHVYKEFGPWNKVADITEVKCVYTDQGAIPRPLVNNRTTFLKDTESLVNSGGFAFSNKFMNEVVQSMKDTHLHWRREGKEKAIQHASKNIAALDWKIAVMEWLERRK